MLTNEERIEAMHNRAAALSQKRRSRQVLAAQISAAVLCLAVIVAAGLQMPGLSGNIFGNSGDAGMSASIFSGSNALGFIVIGIVAFLLGAAFTLFCVRLKKWSDNKTEK